jgi:hypothetical protein
MTKFVMFAVFILCETILAQTKLPYFRKINLPESAKSALNTYYGRWDYCKGEVPAFDPKGKHIGWEYADVIKGDFNGDGNTDYAVLVRLSDSIESRQSNLAVLFGKGNQFVVLVVRADYYSSDNILYLQKRGKSIEDVEAGKIIKLKYDAIDDAIFEKVSTTYYYHDGRFSAIFSGD